MDAPRGGLRPGYGEGPGVGWSGATVNHKTDIWYSFIGWDDFDVMQDADGNPHPGFCFEDFDGNGVADLCAATYPWTNSQGALKNVCVTEDGRRPSLILQPGWKIATALPGTTTAVILYKDGTERQGGPSDIFLRRFVLPAGFDRTRDNPYDVANLVCDQWDTAIVASSPSAYQPAYSHRPWWGGQERASRLRQPAGGPGGRRCHDGPGRGQRDAPRQVIPGG